MPNTNRQNRQIGESKFLGGFKQNWPANQAITLAGRILQPADVIALLQSRVDASTAVEKSNAAWRNDVRTDEEVKARTQAEVLALKQIILAMFGTQIAKLAEFGLVPRKPRTVSPETSVTAAERNRATRVARHTMGKKAKEKIKGAAPAATTTPATSVNPSPTTPSPVAEPAPVTKAPGPAPGAPSPAPVPAVSSAASTPHT